MEMRTLGPLQVSAIGLGCNNFGMRIDEAASRKVVDAALEAGINHFDTADIYGATESEVFLGRALGSRRNSVVVATKFGMEIDPQRKGARPEYVRQACSNSLRRLGSDYIDLYWLHQPDPAVPLAETLGALQELVQSGKVRCYACSNFSQAQLEEAAQEALRIGADGFSAVQNEYSMLQRQPEQDGVLDYCVQHGMGFVPFFPLASGLLSGKYRAGQAAPAGSRLANSARAGRFLNEHNMALVERLLAWLQENAGGGTAPASAPHSLLELALCWLLARPGVASVIAGATSAEQAAANAAAADRELDSAWNAALEAILSADAAGMEPAGS